MNIFDKININHDEEKADKNFSENKNMNKNIVEIKNRNFAKKILSLKNNKRIKSHNHNVISLKKDYANINRIGNIKLYNFSGIKTPYKTRKKVIILIINLNIINGLNIILIIKTFSQKQKIKIMKI